MPDLTLDLRYLRYALVAAEHRSFRRAANFLAVSQSTLSRRIRLLEHGLGFSLFERSFSGVKITSAGANFLNEAAVGVNHFDRAMQLAASVHRGERGELRVGILSSLTSGFLNCVLRRYREKHRDVKVSIYEGSGRENLHRLATEHLDVAFVTGRPELPGYLTALLWSEAVYVALPEDHPLAASETLTWADIQRENFIVSSGGPGPEIQDYLVKRLAGLGFHPEIDVHEVARDSLMSLVAMGYGLTLTSASVLGTEVAGVRFRPIAGDTDILPLSAVWSASNTNRALDRLLQISKAIARERSCKPEFGATQVASALTMCLVLLAGFLCEPAQRLDQLL